MIPTLMQSFYKIPIYTKIAAKSNAVKLYQKHQEKVLCHRNITIIGSTEEYFIKLNWNRTVKLPGRLID